MKKTSIFWLAAGLTIISLGSCGDEATTSASTTSTENAKPLTGQSGVNDDQSQKDVVKIAVGSPDHTTLVKALQQAEYVDALSNAGPFTVFAPTNAAFDKLPKETLSELMKPEKKMDLRAILEYHVFVGVLRPEMLQDGQTYGQASGDNIKIAIKDGKTTINGANVLATIPASNGIIYVVDAVLLPPAK